MCPVMYRKERKVYKGSGGLLFSISEVALASMAMGHFVTSSRATRGQALAEKPRLGSFSCQLLRGHGLSQGTKAHRCQQHNEDDTGQFFLPDSSAGRLNALQAVRDSGAYREAIYIFQTGAKSTTFSQHWRHERRCPAVPIRAGGLARRGQARRTAYRRPPSRRQQLLPDSWSGRGWRAIGLPWG